MPAPLLQNFKKQAYAEAYQAEHGGVIFPHERNEHGSREYYVAPIDDMVKFCLASEDLIMDELLTQSKPSRLFLDMDAEGVSAETMIFTVAELIARTQEGLKELFGLENIPFIELDSSYSEKQSRHVIFQVVFPNLIAMDHFVTLVSDRCHRQTYLDFGMYRKSVCPFRVALARKYKNQVRLVPISGMEGFDFKTTLIQSCLDGLPVAGEEAPEEEEGNSKRSRVSNNAQEDKIFEWLRAFNPREVTRNRKPDTLRISLTGIVCPMARSAHASNHAHFVAHFGKRGHISAHYQCMDEDCGKAIWACDADMDAICFPERERAKMEI